MSGHIHAKTHYGPISCIEAKIESPSKSKNPPTFYNTIVRKLSINIWTDQRLLSDSVIANGNGQK